jgi:hypothetical protein
MIFVQASRNSPRPGFSELDSTCKPRLDRNRNPPGNTVTYHFPQFADDSVDAWGYPDLEHSELDRRLRNLSWPVPPDGARERCLEAILGRPPGRPSAPRPALAQRLAAERVQRYELSRRRLEVRAERVLPAPRRQPRFAAVL